MIDRSRGGDRRRTIRILALGLFPAALVFIQPDLGTALVYCVITLAVAVHRRGPLDPLRGHGGIAAAAVTVVLVIAPAVGPLSSLITSRSA